MLDGVRFASVEDIVAMKLNAVTDGFGRKKDYWDIHFLLGMFTLGEMLDLIDTVFTYMEENGFIR